MRYFTSDHHFYHKNIIEFCDRPWKSVEDMNRGLILRWNKTVSDEDEVMILGDFCFGNLNHTAEIIPQLKGNKTLVMGNHDWKRFGNKESYFGMKIVMGNLTMSLENQIVNISHFPYKGEGDHTGYERYADHRLEDDGRWLLHGHIHQNWKHKNRMINVGVDVWDYKPIPEQTIIDLIKKLDEIYKDKGVLV